MTGVVAKISEKSKSLEDVDFLHSLLGDRVREVVDGTLAVVLFGSGAVGRDLCEVLQLHGVHPVCFCDNNPAQVGNRHFGVPVVSFSELKETGRNRLIVVSSNTYAPEIRQQLLEHGFPAENILPVSPVGSLELLRYYIHCAYYTRNPLHSLTIDDLKNNEEELSAAYDLLADRKSRDIFVDRLALFTTRMDYARFSKYNVDYSEWNEKERDAFPFYVSPEDYGYFNNDVYSLKDGETFVDGGSFNGLSAAAFAKTCEKKNLAYKAIYCFEPDAGNFEVLRRNTAHLPGTTCIRRGLWSEAATLTFLSAGECDPGALLEACGTLSSDACAHKVEVQTISIDEQFPDEEVTLIKMDIEGAEFEAVQGAARTIQRCRPKLAISAYHKHSDIYKLPLLISRLYPAYKFYLRQYGYTLFDMVLFAIAD